MSDRDDNVQELLEVRKVHVDYEEHQQQAGAFDIPVDLHNFKKFPVVDPPGMHKKTGRDTRGDIGESSAELPDYSGPFRADLRFSDFSNAALIKMLAMNDEYFRVCIQGWADEVDRLYGREVMREVQTGAWSNIVLPQLRPMINEWIQLSDDDADAVLDEVRREADARIAEDGVVLANPFNDNPKYLSYPKDRLVKVVLGSHEYLLTVIEAWAADIVVRYGLDAMFDFQWSLWSDKVLPGVRDLKMRWMKVGDRTVEAYMKDIQVDATAYPGKGFEVTFEMPEKEVGVFTFNKCIQVDQWEALGRPDISEKSAHVTCPASIIETAKMYHPNMKVEILAIPPRRSKDDVCCKWRLSMRTPDDPEYAHVEREDTESADRARPV
jgi:hypothetical protein